MAKESLDRLKPSDVESADGAVVMAMPIRENVLTFDLCCIIHEVRSSGCHVAALLVNVAVVRFVVYLKLTVHCCRVKSENPELTFNLF